MKMNTIMAAAGIAFLTLSMVLSDVSAAQEVQTPPAVKTMRVPDGGIQPQVAVDRAGTVHLVYFKGDPRNGDIYYVKSTDAGDSFSKPIRVNSQVGSALAIGSVRGSQLAIGKNNRAHVAWNGSGNASPKATKNESPFLYARLNDDGTAFEEQRNLMRKSGGLDGGGAVAADLAGNVYAVWHGSDEDGHEGEPYRKIWVARSNDEGKSFLVERPIPGADDGACACCGLNAFTAKDGALLVLYRSANEVVHRDIHLLVSTDGGVHAKDTKVHEWNVGQCVMSTAAFCEGSAGPLAAWETKERVYFGVIDPATHQLSKPIAPPNQGNNSKHPAVAVNRDGQVIVAWTVDTAWQKGGAVAWQVFDKNGNPLLKENGQAKELPVWGLVAVFAKPDRGFVVIY